MTDFPHSGARVMGSGSPPAERRIAPETGLEPHFHVTDVRYEIASDGTVLISCYEERRGELRLQFTLTMMPLNLIRASRAAASMAADAHNMAEFQKHMKDGNGGH